MTRDTFKAKGTTPPAAPQQQGQVDALEVFRIAGGDTECEPNPTPERALEVLLDLRACYDEAITQQPETHGGVAAPGSREWMAEVCRAAALSLAAHGVWNDQLLKVADWIAQQGGEVT